MNTQQRIADRFGVSRETVRDWFRNNDNGGNANTVAASTTPKPDARFKYTPEVRS